jgi:hypothetical protein
MKPKNNLLVRARTSNGKSQKIFSFRKCITKKRNSLPLFPNIFLFFPGGSQLQENSLCYKNETTLLFQYTFSMGTKYLSIGTKFAQS